MARAGVIQGKKLGLSRCPKGLRPDAIRKCIGSRPQVAAINVPERYGARPMWLLIGKD
jgi:hypothetical protein